MHKRIAAAIAALTSLTLLFASCSSEEIVSDSIKLPADILAAQPDGSIPILTGDQTAQLRGNIDRGFRLETYYTLGSGEACIFELDKKGLEDRVLTVTLEEISKKMN